MLMRALDQPVQILYWFMVFTFSISFHEMSHALSAYLLGDSTAKDAGRLTMDPLKHLDVFGTIMILIGFIGWAKPVPVNISNFKNKKLGSVIVSFAGPVSNMFLAFVFTFVSSFVFYMYGIGQADYASTAALNIIFNISKIGVQMNILLAVFNLIPIPPLDGSKIFSGILPTKYYFKMMEYHQISFVILIILLMTGILGNILTPAMLYVHSGLIYVVDPIVRLFV